MGIDLDRVRKGLGVSQQTAVVTGGATQVAGYAPPRETYYSPPPPPPLPPQRDERGGGSRAWVWLFVVLLVAAAVALAAVILSGTGDGSGNTDRTTVGSTATTDTTASDTTATTVADVSVPSVVDLPENQAVAQLTSAGLQPRVVRVFSDQPAGTVIAQDPAANQTIPSGTAVRINVSKGVESAPVPDVTNQPLAQAQQTLSSAGFKVESQEQPSDTVPKGAVISQAR
jgi:serine/threonine-protein kinase